ncbi:flavin reductase [Streptomyces sp. SID8379]|uniref:flavin reductase family protein n=1 Tax=unclassified Streptomyces TaxID=2593676 RepID=UPI000366EC79|nr:MULTISPECIES: flavin reductase family protein [unclassified Streptomyces]MYW67574.1 flavin reductase [Streptomyces sp. SID8379]
MTHSTAPITPVSPTGTDSTDSTTTTTAVDTRPLMASFPSGVGVVTALAAGAVPRGMTCSSLASVALHPATLVVCLRTDSPTTRAALESGQFALNLLHEDARAVSDLFASGRPDRFAHTEWHLPLGAAGPHLTGAALAIADCAVVRTVEIGDHTAVFGHVTGLTVTEDTAPLLYGKRRYARWSAAAAQPAPAAAPAAPVLPAAPAAPAVPAPREGSSHVRV